MSRHRQGRQPKSLKLHRQVARRLGGVQAKGHAVLPADPPHGRRVLHHAGHIGAVGHHQEAGIFPDPRRDIRRIQAGRSGCRESGQRSRPVPPDPAGGA